MAGPPIHDIFPPSLFPVSMPGTALEHGDNSMRTFDHVGVPTEVKQPGEMWVEDTKVWVTDPLRHAHRIEYLRFEPDSPVVGAVRDLPHMAFQVDRLEEEIGDAEILLGPFYPTDELRVVFVLKDGAVFEFMEHSGSGHWFREPATLGGFPG